MQLYGPRFMSQLWADPEGNHWQGKQLGKPSLNLAIRGRAGPGIGQQYPHGSPPPLPELQQSIFPQYPSPGIRLHSSDPAQGSNPVSQSRSALHGLPHYLQGLYSSILSLQHPREADYYPANFTGEDTEVPGCLLLEHTAAWCPEEKAPIPEWA